MTVFESVNAFYKVWMDGKITGIPSDVTWKFSIEAWKAYQIGSKKAGVAQLGNFNPEAPAFLLRYPVQVVKDEGYWYQLIEKGKPVIIEGKFSFLKGDE